MNGVYTIYMSTVTIGSHDVIAVSLNTFDCFLIRTNRPRPFNSSSSDEEYS